ncbi:GNAT family N-acetyltransferase [Bifidobacterium dolichotidis]|nr:GNAT family N-acetyltransferase [Bifidobacterium dolichotidis]
MDDLDALATMETACFPPLEAADTEVLAGRIECYPDHFWLMINTDDDDIDATFPAQVEEGTLMSFINGPATNQTDLTDEMFTDPNVHEEEGEWQFLLGVDTAPIYQNHGCAAYLLRRVILDSAISGRKGLVLTCRERLKSYYEQFGFFDEGLSTSCHGNGAWYQMRLVLPRRELDEYCQHLVDEHAEAFEATRESLAQAIGETTSYIDDEDRF